MNKGKDALDGTNGAAEDKAHDGPDGKAKHHGLLAADAVHEKAAEKGPGEVEAVDHGAKTNVLQVAVFRVERTNDGVAEEAERVSLSRGGVGLSARHGLSHTRRAWANTHHEVVKEPGQRGAKHWLPISLQH